MNAVARLTSSARLVVGQTAWQVEPFAVHAGQWVALVPAGPEPVTDPSALLSRILATLAEPRTGGVEILGQNIYQLDYRDLQRLRAHLGFVHRTGGLLSNRTLRDNLALPLWVHRRTTPERLEARVDAALQNLAVSAVADLRPHQIDAAAAWRARLARALILDPRWLVLEGRGPWRPATLGEAAWSEVARRVHAEGLGAAVCLRHSHPEFEAWFVKRGGRIVRYQPVDGEV